MARIPGQAETCQAESVDVRTMQDEAVRRVPGGLADLIERAGVPGRQFGFRDPDTLARAIEASRRTRGRYWRASSGHGRREHFQPVSVGQEVARKYGATPDRYVVAALRVLLGRMGGGRGDGG